MGGIRWLCITHTTRVPAVECPKTRIQRDSIGRRRRTCALEQMCRAQSLSRAVPNQVDEAEYTDEYERKHLDGGDDD